MEDKFLNRMKDLANAKKDKNEVNPKELLKDLREKETTSKTQFHAIAKENIVSIVSNLNNIFEKTGDTFLIFSNEQASTLRDKIRDFYQVFYYPKGRGQNKVGLNTSSLLFECFPMKEIIVVSSNTKLRSAPLEKIKEFSINDFNENSIEDCVSEFVTSTIK